MTTPPEECSAFVGETLHGDDGHNWLYGGGKDDEIFDGADKALLRDGDNNDTLLGGEGKDVWTASLVATRLSRVTDMMGHMAVTATTCLLLF